MKKFLTSLLLGSLFVNASIAQTVSGSIRKTANPLAIEVIAKPTAAINAQVGNINFAISIPDQTLTGGTNPTDAQITKTTTINNVKITADPGNPFIIGNRAYYSYVILQDLGTDVATAFAANADNVVATLAYPSSSIFTDLQLNDLSSSSGGPNFQMTWYVQFNGGIGDVTDVTNPFYGVGAVNNGGTAEQLVILQDGVLPVKFLGFNAVRNNDKAILSWIVEGEDGNTDQYEVLRSINGRDFTAVGTIKALNNGRSSNTYNFTQDNLAAIRTSGVIYFQVKQIDKDGKSVKTEIKNIRINSKEIIVGVYPNPIKQTANVSFDLEKDAVVILSVTDVLGKQLQVRQVQGFKGANIKPLDMSKLAGGNYLLKVQTADETKILPIVKASN